MPDNQWLEAHRELRAVHFNKSATYGTPEDALANFVETGELLGDAPERIVLTRIIEKTTRALHMIDAGNAIGVKEYTDMASLALCAEALRRRRQ